MNIEKTLLNFWRLHKKQPFKQTEILLYFYLVMEGSQTDNYEVCLPVAVIAYYAGISANSVKSARKALKERGVIDYTEGVNARETSTYHVLPPNPTKRKANGADKQATLETAKKAAKLSAKKPTKEQTTKKAKKTMSKEDRNRLAMERFMESMKTPASESITPFNCEQKFKALSGLDDDIASADNHVIYGDGMSESSSSEFVGNTATGTFDVVDATEGEDAFKMRAPSSTEDARIGPSDNLFDEEDSFP